MSNQNSLLLAISNLGRFWQEKINSSLFRWNIFFILAQILLLVLKFNSLPALVPLFYSEPWGESQLVPVSLLFLLPLLSVIVAVTNSLLSVFLLNSAEFSSRLLLIFSLLFSFLNLFTLTRIIFLIS